MSDHKDKPTYAGRAGQAGESRQSGRVAFDARGNPIWEWQTSTGQFSRDVSTQRLKKLEAKELSLMDTVSVALQTQGLSLQEPDKMPGGGVNPYDSGAKAAPHHNRDANRQSLQSKVQGSQSVPQKTPPKQSTWAAFKKNMLGKNGY